MAARAVLHDHWERAVARTGAPAGLALVGLFVAVAGVRFGVLPVLGYPPDGRLQHRLFYFDTAHPWRVWTLATSVVAHNDIAHLVLAGYLVLGLSTLVEPRSGPLALVGVFTATALAANGTELALTAVTGHPESYIGSSAGGFGLLGWLAGAHPYDRLPTVPPGPAWAVAGVAAAVSVGLVLAYGLGAFGISHTGHVAGLVAGVCVGAVTRRRRYPRG